MMRPVRALVEFPLRAPRTVLAVAALATLVLGLQAARIRVDSSIETLLVDGDPERVYHAEVARVFGSDEVTRVGIFGDDVFSPAMLARIHRLSNDLARIEGVRRVVSLTTVTGAEMTGSGILAGKLLRSLPRTAQESAAFRERVLGEPLYLGSLASPDGRATAITVSYREHRGGFSPERIEEQVRAAVASFGGPDEVALSGIPTLKVEGARRMEDDVRRFSALAMLLVVVVLFLMFGNLRGVSLPLLTVALGVIWTDGAMAWRGRPLTIGSLVLNPLLMAVGVAYAMHVMSRYFREATAGRSSREIVTAALDHVAVPVAIAALTTLLGLATLISHPVPTIHDLGLYATFGVAVIFLASVMVVPAILVLLPPPAPRPSRRDGQRLTRGLEALARLTVARPGAVVVVTLGLCVASLAGLGGLRVETDYLGFFSPDSRVRRDSERIAATLAGVHPLYVVVEGGAPDALIRPDSLRAVARLRAFLERQPGIDKSVSVLDYLRLARQAIDPGSEQRLPRSPEEAAQLLMMVDPADLGHALTPDSSRANLLLYTRLSSSTAVTEFVENLNRFALEQMPADLPVRVTGSVVLLNRTSDTIARQQVRGLAQMIAVLFLVLTALFGSLRIGLLSLVPNVVPILLLFGLMGWGAIPLDVSTSMIAVIALGIAVDDTVHYLTEFDGWLRESGDPAEAVRQATRAVGRPIVFTSVALAAGFLVSCLSGFQPVRSFGALSAVTMLIALLADLVLTPAIAASGLVAVGRAAKTAAGERIALPQKENPYPTTGGTYG